MEKFCVFFIFAMLVNQALGQNRPVTPAATVTPATTSPTTMDFTACLRSCPVTSEYNPICGSDNQVYPNPGRLICAQDCGSKVRHVGPAPCPAVSAAPAPAR